MVINTGSVRDIKLLLDKDSLKIMFKPIELIQIGANKNGFLF